METHQDSGTVPPLKVTIVKGKEDISVKISDRGGGIARSQVDQLFKYMYSTAPQPSKSDMHTVPLAGKCHNFKHTLDPLTSLLYLLL